MAYRSGHSDVDAFKQSTANQRTSLYNLRKPAPTDPYPESSVPLFLSDPDGEPDASEYITPLLKERKSLSSRILAGVCAVAGAAILVAMFSSDATRDTFSKLEASMAAVFPAPSSAAPSDPSQLTAVDRQKESSRQSVVEIRTPGMRDEAMATVGPAPEDINAAFQRALQDRAPAAAAVTDHTTPDHTTPGDGIHHLDPDVIASLLRRADALIASGDVAAARLVLRRAADAGDASAAMTLGGTYDPAFLEKLGGVHGIAPDIAMARSWYEKAQKFGSAEAPGRLEMLASRRQ